MRPTQLFASAALASVLALGCGPAEGSCAIDTDCVLGQRCSSDNLCVPLGGGGVDAGARDASVRDAASSDAAPDATAMDAGSDAGLDGCDALAGTYVVGEVGASCGTIVIGQSIVVARTDNPESCTLSIASAASATPVLDGTVSVDEGGAFAATMLSVSGDPTNLCTGTFAAAGLAASCTQMVTTEVCQLGLTR